MHFDNYDRPIDDGDFLPMEIAHHELFTAREKIELLRELKAEVTAERFDPLTLDFAPDAIDVAIEEVKVAAGDSAGFAAVLHGEF